MSALFRVALRNATFSYGSHSEPIFRQFTCQFDRGFTGIVGANGSGKSTLLRILTGDIDLTSGVREGGFNASYCAQRTDAPPATLSAFIDAWDAEACRLKHRLDVADDAWNRWDTLSHGERKRVQIAHALWQAPDILAIDEPTNHIDAAARRLLIDALRAFSGVGILVSHDRELLDALCDRCVWLSPPIASVYVGGVTETLAQRQLEEVTASKTRARLVSAHRQLTRAADQRRERASREHQLRSKRHVHHKDSDARDKINRARVTDGNAGSSLRQVDGRLSQAARELASARVDKTYRTGIWLNTSISRRSAVLSLPAGKLQVSTQRSIHWPDISIGVTDRIAITGCNGAGKSTWLAHARQLINCAQEDVLFLPQEMSVSESLVLLAACRDLPKDTLGQVMSIVRRLNSRPELLLSSQLPSPGETRKLAIAMGMMRNPKVIVMDEPTNHLDLPSIQALGSALAECPCALIVVSHDRGFIEQIGAREWELAANDKGASTLVI